MPGGLYRIEVVIASANSELRACVVQTLAAAGYGVQEAADGLAVLRHLATVRPPTVAVLDQHLPQLDGLQVARLLSLRRGARTRYGVVLLATDFGRALRGLVGHKLGGLPLHALVAPIYADRLVAAVSGTARLLDTASDGGDMPSTAGSAQRSCGIRTSPASLVDAEALPWTHGSEDAGRE